MRIAPANESVAWLTVGAIIAVIVLIVAILGLLGVVPLSQTVIFGLIGALAIARLI